MKALAERAGRKSNEVKHEEEASVRTGSDVSQQSSSYMNPWSEAIATTGMPKIPKVKRVKVSWLLC